MARVDKISGKLKEIIANIEAMIMKEGVEKIAVNPGEVITVHVVIPTTEERKVGHIINPYDYRVYHTFQQKELGRLLLLTEYVKEGHTNYSDLVALAEAFVVFYEYLVVHKSKAPARYESIYNRLDDLLTHVEAVFRPVT